jgi:putative DNA primase/helicase
MLDAPDVVIKATESYRNEMDPVSDFLADCCDQSPEAETPSSDLYQAYAQWCEVYRKKPVSDKAFGMRLEHRGFAATRTSSVRGRKGLALRSWPPASGDTAYTA